MRLSEDFIKSIRWFVIIAPAIVGIYALLLVEVKDTIKPTMVAVLCLGLSFILGTVWKFMKGKILLVTFVLLGLTGIGARYLEEFLYIYLGYIWEAHMVLNWWILAFVIGVPSMYLSFKTFKE
ncbi:MAG: hypothetical protein L6Q57_07390 [Alphaproteobacteria bacterium]|nr:hypothetical protein [Alphaproteobacteria bacterium]